MSYFVFIPFMCIMLGGHLHTHNVYKYLCRRFLEKAHLADAEEQARLMTEPSARLKSMAHVALRQDALRRASHAIIGELASPRNDWHAKMDRFGGRPERTELEDLNRAELAHLAVGSGLDEDEIEDMDHGDLVDYCADGARCNPNEPFEEQEAEDPDDADQSEPDFKFEPVQSQGALKALQMIG